MWDILETPKATKALDKLPVEIIKKDEVRVFVMDINAHRY